MTIPRGRRHTIAVTAFHFYQAGKSERDALDDAIAGTKASAADREDIEGELRRMIEEAPPAIPGLAVVPDADGSVESTDDDIDQAEADAHESDEADRMVPRSHDEAGPIVAPPGAAERDAAVEKIATGAAARSPRRTAAQRLPDAEADYARASEAFARIALLAIADMLAPIDRGAAFARMIKVSLDEGFVLEAIGFVERGLQACGYDLRHVEHIRRRLVDLVEAPAMLVVELLAITPEAWASRTSDIVVEGTRIELPSAMAAAIGRATGLPVEDGGQS